jgi:hypothetical protein
VIDADAQTVQSACHAGAVGSLRSLSAMPCGGGRMIIIETFQRCDAAAGAASSSGTNRDGDAVIRHGSCPRLPLASDQSPIAREDLW